MGHYHPTESVGDKVSAILPFVKDLMIHVSRGVRWDSDHVPVTDDQLREVTSEIVRCGAPGKVHLALDYFDASINRIAAWVVGERATRKALLSALLEPTGRLRELEDSGDYTGRLALLEETRSLPLGAIWDKLCFESGVPNDRSWMRDVKRYEKNMLSKRG